MQERGMNAALFVESMQQIEFYLQSYALYAQSSDSDFNIIKFDINY